MNNNEAKNTLSRVFIKDLKVGDLITQELTPAQSRMGTWPASFSAVTVVRTEGNMTYVQTNNGSNFSRVNLSTVLVSR